MTRTAISLLIVAAMVLPSAMPPAQELVQLSTGKLAARQYLSTLAYPGLPASEPLKCGLGLIAYAMRNRATLSGQLRDGISSILQRDTLPKARTSGHFTVHYDTTAAMLDASYKDIRGTSDQYADSVLAIANRVYAYEVGTLGYLPPPSDGTEGGGPEYDIYVEELANVYGETTPETPLDAKGDGGRWITFMRIDNDFSFVSPNGNKGMPALRVTLAHEFHHAIQIGGYGFWSNQDVFFYEITSTWMEDVVFPGVNDYINYLRGASGQFRNPQVSFESDQLIMYSRCLWGHFIAAKFGRNVMRAAWENVPNVRPLEAMDRALQAMTSNPSNFKTEFLDWTLWNYHTGSRADSVKYYPRGSLYPEIAQIPHEFVPPTGVVTSSMNPLASQYDQVITTNDTVVFIQTNINREAADQDPASLFSYTIQLSSSLMDDSYTRATDNLFFKSAVADPSNWKSFSIVHGILQFEGVAEGVPYPNPFRPTGLGAVFIPAQADYGTLNIYSTSMDLVFSARETPQRDSFGRIVFSWNGYTNNNSPAQSGIYVFVLSVPGRTITGKIALIRK